MKAPAVLVIGSVSYNYILEMKRVPDGGESAVEKNYITTAGGSGGNCALMLSRLGCRAILCANVVRDTNGETLVRYYNGQDIDTRFITFADRGRTGMEFCMLTETESNRTVIYRGANELLSGDDVEYAAYAAYPDAILVQLSAPREAVLAACGYAAKKKTPIYIYAGHDAPDFPLERLGKVRAFITDEKGVTNITGEREFKPSESAKIVMRLAEAVNSDFYFVKLSTGVAILYQKPIYKLAAAVSGVEIIDPATAADTCAAAFVRELIFTGDISRAARFANIVEAATVTGRGGARSIPKYDGIEKFIADKNLQFKLDS